jgi:hypothetical protein
MRLEKVFEGRILELLQGHAEVFIAHLHGLADGGRRVQLEGKVGHQQLLLFLILDNLRQADAITQELRDADTVLEDRGVYGFLD